MRILGRDEVLFAILFTLIFLTYAAFGQVPPTSDEWSSFIEKIAQLKGASVFAIVSVVVQGLMLAFRSQIGSYAGKYQLAILSGLTVVATAMASYNPAIPVLQNIGNILFNAQFIAAINVFYYQVIKKVSSNGSILG